MKVRSRMAILRRIATADVAALKAHAQVDPAVADLQAILASLAPGLYLLHVILDVRACWRHRNLHESFYHTLRGIFSYGSHEVRSPFGQAITIAPDTVLRVAETL